MDETGAYYTEWSKPERKTPMINLFVGQFSNFKFHISLMESNIELILVWWSNTKEVYTHTHTAIPHSAA